MLKKLTKIICLLVAFVFIFSSSSFDVSAASYPGNEMVHLSAVDEEIESLFDQRAALLAQIFGEPQWYAQTQKTRMDALNAIDTQLARKGVTFLSLNEVYEQFPETKNNKAFSGKTMKKMQGDTLTPQAEIPDSPVNTWASYRSTYTSNGVTYNIQKLIAQPSSPSSPLAEVGTRTVTFSRNWEAGAVNVFSTLAEASLEGLVGEIPGASFALTFLDAVDSFIAGVSTTTEVDVPHITYSWSLVTTASFMYVRQNNQTDDYQWLSLVCTKTATQVGYQIPCFGYVDSGGTSVLTPNVIQGDRMIYNTPNNYNSDSLAVSAYNAGAGFPLQNCIGSIDITAPEGKRVERISPCYPSYPIHCEF